MELGLPRLAAAVLVALVGLGGCGASPTEDSPAVDATLDDLAEEVRDEADALARLARQELPVGTEVVASGPARSCTRGQHDWKRDDPFDLSCVVGHLVVLGIPSAATFRSDMDRLDRTLQAAGLADRRPGEVESQGLTALAEDFFGLLGHEWSTGPNGESIRYGPQDLPSASYFANQGDRELTLSFTGPDDSLLGATALRDADLDADEVLALLAHHEYALVIDAHVRVDW